MSPTVHWTDTDKALEQLLRVTKKGGRIFGTNNFFPNADPYSNLHLRVIKGVTGYIHQDEFKKLARRHGATKVKLTTPISVFTIEK